MNISPAFVNGIPFRKFKRAIGPNAIGYLVTIGLHCQQNKTPEIEIPTPEDLELMLDCDGGEVVLQSIIESKLIEQVGDGVYYCHFFVEQNKQLLSNWANGELKKQNKKNADSSKKSRSFVQKPAVRNAVFGRDNHKCVYCDSTEDLTIDHIVPLAAGGKNELGNLQTLCFSCNTIKNDSIEPDWVKENSTQGNSIQSNSNQSNSTQLNRYATQPKSNASQPKSNASSTGNEEPTQPEKESIPKEVVEACRRNNYPIKEATPKNWVAMLENRYVPKDLDWDCPF